MEAVNRLKQGKAAGPGEILTETLKVDVKLTADILLPLFTKIWTDSLFTSDWKRGFKKGGLSKCNNYRGVIILSIPRKLSTQLF